MTTLSGSAVAGTSFNGETNEAGEYLLANKVDEESLLETRPESFKAPSRCFQLLVSIKWILVHQGSACFIAMCVAIFGCGLAPGVLPTFAYFVKNPADAWPAENFAAFVFMVIVTVVSGYYVAEQYLPPKKKKVKSWVHFTTSIAFISFVGFLALWTSAQKTLHEYGLTNEVWGFVFGMVVCNCFSSAKHVPSYLGSAARGEDFIKVGLVLLGVDINTVLQLAGPAIPTSWPVTVVVLWFSFFVVAVRMLKIDRDTSKEGAFTKSLALMLSCGLAICGSSASTAVHGAIPDEAAPNKDAELGLTIAILNAFTVVQMIVWPYVAYGIGFPLEVAASWFGGTIDGAGNVVASGAIFDGLSGLQLSNTTGMDGALLCPGSPAVEIASTVKIIQIVLICPVTVFVTIYWMVSEEGSTGGGKTRGFREWAVEIYDRFPKFVVGFLAYAIVLALVSAGADENTGNHLTEMVLAVRTWWFTIGFVGVGMGTHVKTMARQLKGGKVIMLYVLGQGFDLILTLAAAYLFFWVLFRDQSAQFIDDHATVPCVTS